MDVANHTAEHRFEIHQDGQMAFLTYRESPGLITLLHTDVPKALEGRGIGGTLARAALDHARAQNLKVVVHCPFVTTYLQRHPEYSDLLA